MMNEPAQGRSLPRHFVAQFFCGASYPFRALTFLQRHRLWRLAMVAVAVNVVLLLVVLGGLWYSLWPWLHHTALSLQDLAHQSDTLRTVLIGVGWLMWLVVVPVVFVVSGVVVLLIGQVVASPFLDILSERVECLVIPHPSAPMGIKRMIDSIFMAVADALWGVLYLVAIYIPILLLSFVPGVGAVASVCFASLLLAQEFVGMPLARHLISYRARWRLILRNKGFCLGFGSVATVLLGVPGLNMLLLPLATVGGTLLYCDLQTHGLLTPLPDPLGDRSSVRTLP